MGKAKKSYLIGVCVCAALLFVWIFVTVALTGGRDIPEFTERDCSIFTGFIFAELATVAMIVFFCIRANKSRPKSAAAVCQPSAAEKRKDHRGALLLVAAWLLAFFPTIFGAALHQQLPPGSEKGLGVVLIVSCAFIALLFPVNILLKKAFFAKYPQKKLEEWQQFFFAHRESAEQTAAEKLPRLKKLRRLTDVYAALLCLPAATISLCAGLLGNTDLTVPLCFLSGFVFLAAGSRIRFSDQKRLFEEDDSQLSAADYPALYAMAQRAADALGCKGKLRIAVISECNAAICQTGDTYSVAISAILLAVLSEEELYAILLHEFSHLSSENRSSDKVGHYAGWLSAGGNPHFLSALTAQLFSCSDAVVGFEYELYRYSVSVLEESRADRAAAEYGDRRFFASALLKLKYHQLFLWENETADAVCPYSAEELTKDNMRQEIEKYTSAMEKRADAWNELAKTEILSRSASHPTLKMRLAALGVADYRILDGTRSNQYASECSKALDLMESLIYEFALPTYPQTREQAFLEPERKIAEWKAAGSPLVAHEYADLVIALRQLCRESEAERLCDSVLAELTDAACNFARFTKGVFLLHRYDAAGLALVYQAMENNSNYIDDGLNIIGEFCCLTGRQEELDEYRAKAVMLGQKELDVYSHIGELKRGDTLSAEQLPEGLLERVLDYIRSVGGDAVQAVFLVRKTISEDFFTSPVVIQYADGVSEEKQNEIQYQVFCFLDTCSDWQFSLFSYKDVRRVGVERIAGSCVYRQSRETKPSGLFDTGDSPEDR